MRDVFKYTRATFPGCQHPLRYGYVLTRGPPPAPWKTSQLFGETPANFAELAKLAELEDVPCFTKTVVTRAVVSQNGVVSSRKSTILAFAESRFVGNTHFTVSKGSQNTLISDSFPQS